VNNLKFLMLSWDDIQNLSEKVAKKVKDSGFKVDVIVAISRGGFDPARIISDQLGVRNLASLQIVYYDGLNERRMIPEIQYPLNADVRGLRTLVVDDVADSGNSLKVVKEYVRGQGATDVKIATLHLKPWSDFHPDYYADTVDAWIIYPWELKESLLDLVEKLTKDGLTRPTIVARLNEIGFTSEQILRYSDLLTEDI
jgi:hypoxanthine phosphoribosyltransferase